MNNMENLDFGRKIKPLARKENLSLEPKPIWERITDEAIFILQTESPELFDNFGEAKIKETAKDFLQSFRSSWSEELAKADNKSIKNIEENKAKTLAKNIKEKLLS